MHIFDTSRLLFKLSIKCSTVFYIIIVYNKRENVSRSKTSNVIVMRGIAKAKLKLIPRSDKKKSMPMLDVDVYFYS